DIGFTGGGAGKEHGMIYLDGDVDHRIDNSELVDHLVELVEKRAEEIEAREAAEAVAAE
ncbi:MAG: 4-hydroxy-3-methylbut-2-en-1-yl diphosphate synthase, partial [Pseudomonadota bacterium]